MTDLTDGQRIYAIGDMHGCSNLLDELQQRIAKDLEDRPHAAPHVICLGDYCDRGPDTPGVIDRLIAMKSGPMKASFLLGNHDNYMPEFLKDSRFQDIHLHWFDPRMGGDATLKSYGVDPLFLNDRDQARDEFESCLPAAHLAFLKDCDLCLPIGGYIFVHAGIRPGVALADQTKEDLIWIRDEFLPFKGDLGAKVVHGHTIVDQVQHHSNRIAVDTGAFRTGVLSCVVLEGDSVQLLGPEGVKPLPEGSGVPV